MKVSVPLPPPPLPVPEGPVDTTPPAAAPPSAWPAWHGGMDKLLYLLLLLTAVLAGMFVARNADIWRHLAVGRMLVQGKYTPGSDPLSYTGAGRAWVNPNVLFEPFAYAVYSVDRSGAALVAVKAFAFAGAFLLLFQLRRAGTSLWPWCVLLGLGILAAAPQATLRPQAFGMLALAAALLLVYRGDWAHRWRAPLLYGGLVAVWGMFDASAFLGPWLILLLAIGETIRPTAAEANDLTVPPSQALWRTLPLAILGWLLNPSILLGLLKSPGDVLGQLIPAELFFGYTSLVGDDLDLVRTLAISAFSSEYAKGDGLGANANGLAALSILVLSGLAIAIRFRLSQLLLWLGFAYLPVAHFRWIPFFAIVAAPMAAAFFAQLGRSLQSATHDEQRRKILVLSAGIGRIFSLVGVLAMLLAAIPGWLHPRVNDDATFYRRVDWGLDSDTGARRGAELVGQWRSRGELPSEVNLLLAYADYGDYSAWFAPQERVFANTRYQFHRSEIPDLVSIREVLRGSKIESDAPIGKLLPIANKYRAGGIVICRGNIAIDNGVVARAALGFGAARSIGELFSRVWAIDGRFAAVGRDDVEPYQSITGKLAFDSVKAAFGPQAAPVSPGTAGRSAGSAEGIVARFLERPSVVPAETDDSMVYRDRAALETQDADGPWLSACYHGSGALAGAFNAYVSSRLNPNLRPPSDTELAFETLAARSARAGAAKNPDSPHVYRALAGAYQLRYASQAQLREADLVPLAALSRAVARYPLPDAPRDRFTKVAILDGLQLFLMQLKLQQYDAALQSIQAVLERTKNAQPADLPPPQFVPDFYRSFFQTTGVQPPPILNQGEKPETLPTKGADWVKKKLEDIRDLIKEKIFAQKNGDFNTRMKAPVPSNQDAFGAAKLTLAEQYILACELGLPQKALDLVPDNLAEVAPTEYAVRLKAGVPPQLVQTMVNRYRYLLTPFTLNRPAFDVDLRLQTISLMLQLGKVEQAAETLQALDVWFDEHASKQPDDKNIVYWRDAMAGLKAELAWITGDFPRTEEYLRQRIREQPRIKPQEIADALRLLRGPRPQPPETSGWIRRSVAMLDLALAYNRAARVSQSLQAEAHNFYELGLNALQAGNIPQARDAFAQSLKPQGIPLDDLGVPRNEPARMFAERYLQLIDRSAEKTP